MNSAALAGDILQKIAGTDGRRWSSRLCQEFTRIPDASWPTAVSGCRAALDPLGLLRSTRVSVNVGREQNCTAELASRPSVSVGS